MKRLSVTARLSAAQVGDRYRRCPDSKGKTRWHSMWLLLQDPTLTCERAGPLVGLSDTHARAVLERWNASGPGALTDGRMGNGSEGKLTPAQPAEAFDALTREPPDGGLWSGPKLARYARDRWGVAVCPATGWRWLRKLGSRLVAPRPRHPKAASAGEQRGWLWRPRIRAG